MVKTITIKDSVHAKLIKAKAKDESFSTLLERLIKSARPIDVLKKIRASAEFRNKREMIKEV
jgi:predicted CopG family antitoxin